MPSIKLVFFDLEGTVLCKCSGATETKVAPSSWFTIAQHLGEEALNKEKATQVRWNNGEYSGYLEWMEDTICIHKKYGLKRNVFERILGTVDLMPGAEATFDSIHSAGVHTALVTGGFKEQACRAGVHLGIRHVYAGCEYFWDEEGRLAFWNLLPADYHGKVDFVRSVARDYGYCREELAFVGDGQNDVHLVPIQA